MQIEFFHQVAADVTALTGLKQHVVGQRHCRPSTGFQAAVNVLQECQLLVAGGIGEDGAVGKPPPFLVSKGGLVRIKSALGKGE